MASWLELAAGSNVSTPLDGALQITGDIDLRAEITPADWTPTSNQAILGRWLTAGGATQRSYRMDLLTNGRLRFTWSVTGQSGAANISSTVSVTPPESGRLAVRATFDVNNGAGGRTIRFYTAPSLAGPWTQLGNPVTQGGATSVHAGTAPLTVGAYNAGASEPFVGLVWAAEVRDGIDGSLVAAVDFTGLAGGTTAFTDATGRDWTIAGNASIVAAPVLTGEAESAVTASGGASGLRRVVGTAASEAGGSAVATGVRQTAGEATSSVTTAGAAAAGVRRTAGEATSSVTTASTATGAPVRGGEAESAVTTSGEASGLRRVVGTAASEAGGSAVATGVRRTAGEAASSVTTAGTVTGAPVRGGTATSSATTNGEADGTRRVVASAESAVATAQTASGRRITGGATAESTVTTSASATGVRTARATAGSSVVVSGTAEALRRVLGAGGGQVVPLVASTGLVRVVGVAGSSVVTQGGAIVAVADGDGADVTVTESLLPESVAESSGAVSESVAESSGAVSVTPEPAGAVNLAESDRIVSVAEPSPSVLVTPEPAGAVNLAESDRIVSVAEPSPSVLVEEPL